jgi:hypothetical protein
VEFPNPLLAVRRLGAPPGLPKLTSDQREFYHALATDSRANLWNGSSLSGMVGPPTAQGQVYFVSGDLHLGTAGVFRPQGHYIVYVTGDLSVHQTIEPVDSGWAVFLVEGDIILQQTLTDQGRLAGTFLSNGRFKYEGMEFANGELNVYGSLLAGNGFDIARGWQRSRQYHQYVPDALDLPLPHLIDRIEYRVIAGKFG